MPLTARTSLTFTASVVLLATSLTVGSASAAEDDTQSTGQQSTGQQSTGQQSTGSTGGHNHGTTASSDADSGTTGQDSADADDTGTERPSNNLAQQIPPPPAVDGICQQSDLAPHEGFQEGPSCVSLEMGEMGAATDNPQLLITDAPQQVGVNEPFTLKVSSRNLVRDTFLPAADGGYYVQSGELDNQGIVRGHFHTACRVLDSTNVAPNPDQQDVFVATEDGGGGAGADTVDVKIPGLPAAGEAQCATWAGDGSHRIPMMVFANQVPAFDAVRIQVNGNGGQNNGGQNNGGQNNQNQGNADQGGQGNADQGNQGNQGNADQGGQGTQDDQGFQDQGFQDGAGQTQDQGGQDFQDQGPVQDQQNNTGTQDQNFQDQGPVQDQPAPDTTTEDDGGFFDFFN